MESSVRINPLLTFSSFSLSLDQGPTANSSFIRFPSQSWGLYASAVICASRTFRSGVPATILATSGTRFELFAKAHKDWRFLKSGSDRFSSGLIGLDPDDLLTDPSPLRAESSSRAVIIGRCSCGIVGCGSVEVEIRRDHDHVIWMAMDSSQQVCFLADQPFLGDARAHSCSTDFPSCR